MTVKHFPIESVHETVSPTESGKGVPGVRVNHPPEVVRNMVVARRVTFDFGQGDRKSGVEVLGFLSGLDRIQNIGGKPHYAVLTMERNSSEIREKMMRVVAKYLRVPLKNVTVHGGHVVRRDIVIV